MKIFSDEFINFLRQKTICSWRGHKKSKLVEVYWAPGHSSGYRSKFCETCNEELETTRKDGRMFERLLNQIVEVKVI